MAARSAAKPPSRARGRRSSQAKKLLALSQISEAVTSDLSLDAALDRIVRVTAEALGFRICSLMLYDEEKKELALRATQSVSQAYNAKSNLRLGEGIAGLAAQERRPIAARDVRKDPRYVNQKIAKQEGLCSLLSVPLLHRGNVVGVLNCYTAEPSEFKPDENAMIMTVAGEAAIAIQNARLAAEKEEMRDRLEERKLVERAKDILVAQRGISGEEAYRILQRESMNRRKPIKEIAQAVILASELGSRPGSKAAAT